MVIPVTVDPAGNAVIVALATIFPGAVFVSVGCAATSKLIV